MERKCKHEYWKMRCHLEALSTLPIDEVDAQIIRILTDDARISNVEIAREIGVSEGTVRRRIDLLIEKGIIQGFVAVTKVSESCIKVFIRLEVEETRLEELADKIRNHKSVVALYRLNGEYNLLCEAMFPSLMEMQQYVDTCTKLDGIFKSEVQLVVGSYKKCFWTGV
ncbi:MAG: Lrp/AsnC family transcriptional regulator [Methanophagales archaeon ANME-1-THS]|nr:MAG: Lrp/AsnC family transcriptional regulator [Methanophagales archaeon ANME-1-THS]